jgi:hypothetical protein
MLLSLLTFRVGAQPTPVESVRVGLALPEAILLVDTQADGPKRAAPLWVKISTFYLVI